MNREWFTDYAEHAVRVINIETHWLELRGWITKNGRHILIGDAEGGGGSSGGAGKRIDKSAKNGIIKSGAVSGALSPVSKEAQAHAEQYYESVRKMKTDVKNISNNTGFSESDILQIKNHVFIAEHDLGGDIPERFYPNYAMAQSWQRLIDGKNIQKHDITLLHHEKMESDLMKKGLSQLKAHRISEKKYNYAKESREYYAEVNKHSNRTKKNRS